MNRLVSGGNHAGAAGLILADEADRGVQSDAIKPGIGVRRFAQVGQRAPELEDHLLIQIVLISATPGVDTADFQKSRAVIGDQLQKPVVIIVRCRVQLLH